MIQSDQEGIDETETYKLLCFGSSAHGRLPSFLFLHNVFFLLACLSSDPKRNAWRQHTNALNDSKRQHSDRHINELFSFGATIASL